MIAMHRCEDDAGMLDLQHCLLEVDRCKHRGIGESYRHRVMTFEIHHFKERCSDRLVNAFARSIVRTHGMRHAGSKSMRCVGFRLLP